MNDATFAKMTEAIHMLVFFAVLGLVLLGTLRGVVFGRRRRQPAPDDITDPRRQLEFVSKVQFTTQPLVNKSEYLVLLILEKAAREANAGFRVMAQTSLGEILTTRSSFWGGNAADLAYRSINSKRADFVIVDKRGIAVLAVEYQGSGHYQGTAHLRDAVKREAFRSAGVTFLEVPAGYRQEDLAREVSVVLLSHKRLSTVR